MQVIGTTAGDIVQHAVSEAMESPELPPEDLFSDVYCGSNYNIISSKLLCMYTLRHQSHSQQL